MEPKRPRLIGPALYNRLPVPDTDFDTCFPWQKFKIRLVEKTDSREWGPPQSAELRATHTLDTTPKNEQLLRTHHPALRSHYEVFVSDPQFGPEVWLARGTCADIMAGGRALHPFPEDRLDLYPWGRALTPRSPVKEEYLFRECINPRKLLSPEQLDAIRELFPAAIGARVHVTGFLVILYKSVSEIKDLYERDWIHEVGGLRTVYDTPGVVVSADTVTSGWQVAEVPESINGSGCLGLKLQMPDGREVMTTVTHGFVRNSWPSRVTLMFSDWILRAKSSLRRFLRRPPPSDTCALGVVRNSPSNSPVGKEVWLATEKKKVGTITQTFDNPSPVLPYPAGYRHDLSLITDDDLPALVSPPGYPVVSEWASYSDALSGSDVYAVRMNVVTGNWLLLQGAIDPDAIRDATVIGTQYLWDRESQSQTASLLWTTRELFSPATGWSGSVICLGRPTDQSSRAIVFQNYEVPCRSFVDPTTKKSQDTIVKAGFLLPESVRSSIIISHEDRHRPRNSLTYPRRSGERGDLDRRIFSAL